MRTVNIKIKEMDIHTEDLLCDIIDRMGYEYVISTERTKKEKKKKTYQEVVNELWHRFDNSNFVYDGTVSNGVSILVTIIDKNERYRTGVTNTHAGDKHNLAFGKNLGLARACGWADLEKELIESYYG